jgi:hypothetical protein
MVVKSYFKKNSKCVLYVPVEWVDWFRACAVRQLPCHVFLPFLAPMRYNKVHPPMQNTFLSTLATCYLHYRYYTLVEQSPLGCGRAITTETLVTEVRIKMKDDLEDKTRLQMCFKPDVTPHLSVDTWRRTPTGSFMIDGLVVVGRRVGHHGHRTSLRGGPRPPPAPPQPGRRKNNMSE